MQSIPEIGQLAIVRKRPFVVAEIIPSAPGLGGEATRPSPLIQLSSVEDDGRGEAGQESNSRHVSVEDSSRGHPSLCEIGL